MNILWGIIVFVISMIGWLGQALSAFRPATAVKLGLTEPEGDVDPTFYADLRGEAYCLIHTSPSHVTWNSLYHETRIDSLDRLLARGIDRQNERLVCGRQLTTEISCHCPGSTVEMGLKYDDQSRTWPRGPHSGYRSTNLGRVVSVVVDYDHVVSGPDDLKPAFHAPEVPQATGKGLHLSSQMERGNERSRCVLGIVSAGSREIE